MITNSEKINVILNSDSLENLPLSCWPQSHEEKYFFISYSHKDYKDVFPIIFGLEENEIMSWYDRSIVAGDSWTESAERKISSFFCIATIFFISKNSLSSSAIWKEIKYCLKHKKEHIAYCIGGSSPLEVYESLDDSEKKQTRESALKRLFKKEEIYLNSNVELSKVIEKLKPMFFKKQQYYCYSEVFHRHGSSDPEIKLVEASDYNFNLCESLATLSHIMTYDLIHAPKIPDYISLPDGSKNGKLYQVARIGNAAFANSIKLERITLPRYLQIIKADAFYNCRSLEAIEFPNTMVKIGSSAFAGCSSLKTVKLNEGLEMMKDWAFAGCSSLKKITIPASVKKIGSQVFQGCKNLTIIFEKDFKGELSEEYNPDNCNIIFKK